MTLRECFLGAVPERVQRVSSTDIIPVVSVSGIRLMRDGFRERDAGDLSLDVDGDTTNSLVGSLGLRLRREFKISRGTIIPEVKAAWLHEFVGEDYALNGSFAGYPASTFTVNGDRGSRDSVSTGFVLTWETRRDMDLYLSCDAILSGDQTGQMGSLGIRYRW